MCFLCGISSLKYMTCPSGAEKPSFPLHTVTLFATPPHILGATFWMPVLRITGAYRDLSIQFATGC